MCALRPTIKGTLDYVVLDLNIEGKLDKKKTTGQYH